MAYPVDNGPSSHACLSELGIIVIHFRGAGPGAARLPRLREVVEILYVYQRTTKDCMRALPHIHAAGPEGRLAQLAAAAGASQKFLEAMPTLVIDDADVELDFLASVVAGVVTRDAAADGARRALLLMMPLRMTTLPWTPLLRSPCSPLAPAATATGARAVEETCLTIPTTTSTDLESHHGFAPTPPPRFPALRTFFPCSGANANADADAAAAVLRCLSVQAARSAGRGGASLLRTRH